MEREEEARDVTAPSPVKHSHVIEFREGSRLEAKDHMGEKWWEAKVLEVDTEGSEVLVHFTGWNGRHDEWIKMDSPRLQPYTRKSSRNRRQSSDTHNAPPPTPFFVQTPPEQPTGPALGGVKELKLGEEVMALWQNNRKYPARVEGLELDGSYSVKFFDGFKKSVRPNCVRRILPSDFPFVMECKSQVVNREDNSQVNGSPPPPILNGERNKEAENHPSKRTRKASSTSVESPIQNVSSKSPDPPPKLRRERKSKFNVREILNLKETSPKKSSSTSISASGNNKTVKDQHNSTNLVVPDSAASAIVNDSKIVNKSDASDDAVTMDGDANSNNSVNECNKCDNGDTTEPVIEVVDLSESFDVKSEASAVSETGSEGAPSEKENIICCDNNKHKSSSRLSGDGDHLSSLDTRTKRARKRKRFADEDLELNSAVNKFSKTNSLHTSIHKSKQQKVPSSTDSQVSPNNVLTKRNTLDLTRKSRPRVSGKKVDLTSTKESSASTSSRTLVNSPQNNNGMPSTCTALASTYSYLNFDFTLPHEELKSIMVEGINVPGLKKPLLMNSPKLPDGWVKKVVVRSLNKWDVFIEREETGKIFKNRVDLSRYFEEFNLDHDLDLFDFCLDTPLKKLRQIWKASKTNIKHEHQDDSSTSSSGTLSPIISPASDRLSGPSEPKSPSVTPKKTVKKPLKLSNNKLRLDMGTNGANTSHSPRSTISTLSPVIGNLSETGQGVRCPVSKCNKLFRNEKLLHMHVKHYHPQFNNIVGNSPSVTDLAFQRTRIGDEARLLDVNNLIDEVGKESKEEPVPSNDGKDKKHKKSDAGKGLKQEKYLKNGKDPKQQKQPDIAKDMKEKQAEVEKGMKQEIMPDSFEDIKQENSSDEGKAIKQENNEDTQLEAGDKINQDVRTGINDSEKENCLGQNREVIDKKEDGLKQNAPNEEYEDKHILPVKSPTSLLTPGASKKKTILYEGKICDGEKLRKVISEKGDDEKLELIKSKDDKHTIANLSTSQVDVSSSTSKDFKALATKLKVEVKLSAVEINEAVIDKYQLEPKLRTKRSRTESIISVGSETPFTPPPSPPATSSTPSTSYKLSRRRAQQLRSGPTTPPTKEGEVETDGLATMTEEEVVNCKCSNTDGDGMMIQCEICLTWQHGACLGVETEDQVPDKYICSICQNPPMARESRLFNIDHEWITAGKLSNLLNIKKSVPPTPKSQSETRLSNREKELNSLSDLMSELVTLSSILHSLQVKLAVAVNNAPKVFMWSCEWQEESVSEVSSYDNVKECDVDDTFINQPGEELHSKSQSTENEKKKDVEDEFFDEKLEESKPQKDPDGLLSPSPASSSQCDDSGIVASQSQPDAKSRLSPVSNDPVSEPSRQSKNEETDSHNFQSDLSDYFPNMEGFENFPSNLLPSVSEMQKLLPGVIQDISGFSPQPMPSPNIIPEPKRLDRDECRANLVCHIEQMQAKVDIRLTEVETRIDKLEAGGEPVSPDQLANILQDIRNARRLNLSLPDRI